MADKNSKKFSKSKADRTKKTPNGNQKVAFCQETSDLLKNTSEDCEKKRIAVKRHSSDEEDNGSTIEKKKLMKKSENDSGDKRGNETSAENDVTSNLNIPEAEQIPNLETSNIPENNDHQDDLDFLGPRNFLYFPVLPESLDYFLDMPAFRETLRTDVVTLFKDNQ